MDRNKLIAQVAIALLRLLTVGIYKGRPVFKDMKAASYASKEFKSPVFFQDEDGKIKQYDSNKVN